jgi:hypothetical protein
LFGRRVDTSVRQFARLDTERQRIEEDSVLTVERTLDIYSSMIANLLAAESELGGQTNDRNLIRNIATFVALGRFKEAASQERGLVYAAASAGRFAPGQFQRFATSLGAQDTWRAQFNATSSGQQSSRLEAIQANPDVLQTNELRNFLRNGLFTGNATGKVELDPREWFLRSSARIDLLREVENSVAGDVAAASAAAKSSARREAVLYTALLILTLGLTIVLSLWLARSMVRPLRTLTRSAKEVAEDRLPGLV